MIDVRQGQLEPKKSWVRIPDGTMVRHRSEGHEGYVDGLTELANGPHRNPDGRTQYRVKVGDADRKLAIEDDLLIITDADGLVVMFKQKTEYRCFVSQHLHGVFAADRFVKSA
jgi:hypothetical protein